MKYLHPQSNLTSSPPISRPLVGSVALKVTQALCSVRQMVMGKEQSVLLNTRVQGFSLIETLVAITILLIVIVGPMSITSSTARSTSFASDQVTAFFLAQEGAELIQKARDDLLLRQFLSTGDGRYLSNPWSEFIRTSGGVQLQNCYTTDGCGVELADGVNGTLTPAILPRCQSGACRLYYNESANIKRSRYTHTSSGNEITPFTRRVRIERMNDFEVKVISEVSWRSGLTSAVQTVVVENHLFNVYAN